MDESLSLYDVEKVKKNTARTGIPKCGGGIADRSELQYAEEDLVRHKHKLFGVSSHAVTDLNNSTPYERGINPA